MLACAGSSRTSSCSCLCFLALLRLTVVFASASSRFGGIHSRTFRSSSLRGWFPGKSEPSAIAFEALSTETGDSQGLPLLEFLKPWQLVVGMLGFSSSCASLELLCSLSVGELDLVSLDVWSGEELRRCYEQRSDAVRKFQLQGSPPLEPLLRSLHLTRPPNPPKSSSPSDSKRNNSNQTRVRSTFRQRISSAIGQSFQRTTLSPERHARVTCSQHARICSR